MYLSKKWFFFIEWSIMAIIAWAWIVGAALLPTMTAYMMRSRDATRVSHLSMVSTILETYYLDTGKYPETSPSWCLPKEALKEYLQKIPIDPSPWHYSSGCDGSDGMTYSYTSYVHSDKSPHFILEATMESENSGNSPVPMRELSFSESGTLTTPLLRWSGKEYIILN